MDGQIVHWHLLKTNYGYQVSLTSCCCFSTIVCIIHHPGWPPELVPWLWCLPCIPIWMKLCQQTSLPLHWCKWPNIAPKLLYLASSASVIWWRFGWFFSHDKGRRQWRFGISTQMKHKTWHWRAWRRKYCRYFLTYRLTDLGCSSNIETPLQALLYLRWTAMCRYLIIH